MKSLATALFAFGAILLATSAYAQASIAGVVETHRARCCPA